MTIADLLNRSLQQVKRNSPEILTGLGVAGVVTTGYLMARASFKASAKLHRDDAPIWDDTTQFQNKRAVFLEQFKETWVFYIPPAVSGTITVVSILGATKASGRRTAAAVTAYSLTERAFSEYKEHVVEQLGKGKEQKLRDEIAQNHVTENPPGSRELLMISDGDVLCCELYTGRYFKCDMETLRRAENEINHMVNTSAGLYVTLSDFYDILELPHTSESDNLGWDCDKLLELQFSAVLTPEDHKPCIAFEYNYVRPQERRKYN